MPSGEMGICSGGVIDAGATPTITFTVTGLGKHQSFTLSYPAPYFSMLIALNPKELHDGELSPCQGP